MNDKKFSLPFSIPDFKLDWFHTRKQRGIITSKESRTGSRFHAYGRARVEIAQKVSSQQDWEKLWKSPRNSFPFVFASGLSWKQCMEYHVLDYESEIGFWIDGIGLDVIAFGPVYSQFSIPSSDFTFAVTPTTDTLTLTPPGSIRFQFMIKDLSFVVDELISRKIVIYQFPLPIEEKSAMHVASFLTPNGHPIDLWGEIHPNIEAEGFNLDNDEGNNIPIKNDYPIITFVGNPDLFQEISEEENEENITKEQIPANPSRWRVDPEQSITNPLDNQETLETDKEFPYEVEEENLLPDDNQGDQIEACVVDDENQDQVTYEPVEDENDEEETEIKMMGFSHFPNRMNQNTEKPVPKGHIIKRC
jgi:hypothetical protein